MSTTLTTIILTKAADWAFGKALDVIWDCLTCKDKNPGRIGNVMHNDLECPNCHKVHRQFTNACPTTVRLTDGRIGHIGVSYAGLIPDDRSTLQKLFGDAPPPRCGFDLHVNQLPAVQLVERMTVTDYERGRELFYYGPILLPTKRDADFWLKQSFGLPENPDRFHPKKVLISLNFSIEDKRKEILYKESFLEEASLPIELGLDPIRIGQLTWTTDD